MGLGNLQMLYLVATMLIVYESSLTATSSYGGAMAVTVDASLSAVASAASLKETEMDVKSFTHINKPSSIMAGMVNRLPRHAVEGLQKQQNEQVNQQQQQQQQQIEDPSSTLINSKIKRSFSTGAGWASSTFNGLAGLMGSSQQHNIRGNSYEQEQEQQQQQHSLPQLNHQYQQYTEAKPIYEEQQENDYAGGSSYNNGGGSSASQHSIASVANAAALHSAIYNLQTAGTHNAAVGTSSSSSSGSSASNGGSDGFLPSWNFGKLSTSFIASTPYASGSSSSSGSHGASTSNNNEKISEGNFLHHYDSASAFNEYTPQHDYQSYQQQQQQLLHLHQHQHQQQQLPQHENFYNSVEHTEADSSHSSSYSEEQEHDENHYSPSASAGHFSNFQQQHEQQQEKQPDVINYVPYPVVKKQHVPVREQVQIPISHAVIIPVSKPVPIHVPVTQNVQVPVEKELKIPVERVVPYPVEKHIPVPVEKRVPYPVVKYVPIKVSRPFPVKVPVFKTVLHKVKGWW